jgi:hypothetical protein
VGAAASRLINVSYIGARGWSKSVKEQGVGIGQAEPPDNEDDEEKD